MNIHDRINQVEAEINHLKLMVFLGKDYQKKSVWVKTKSFIYRILMFFRLR